MKEYVDPQGKKKENSDLFKYKLNYNFEKVKQLIIILKNWWRTQFEFLSITIRGETSNIEGCN